MRRSGSLHNSSTHPTERNVTAFANKVPKEAGRGCQPDGAKLLTSTPSRGERTLFPAQGAPLGAEERSWLLGKNQEAEWKVAQATHRKPAGKRAPPTFAYSRTPSHLATTKDRGGPTAQPAPADSIRLQTALKKPQRGLLEPFETLRTGRQDWPDVT